MKKPKISIIAAIGKNRELGKDNKLLWHIPEDLKRFRKLTEGHVVIMGRKTFESIGKPLPNRLNIVITRSKTRGRNFYRAKKFLPLVFQSSIEEAINYVKNLSSNIYHLTYKDEVFVIGGGQIYKQAIKYADKLYLTIIDKEFPQADTFFPDYSPFTKVVFEQKGEGGGYLWRWIELEK